MKNSSATGRRRPSLRGRIYVASAFVFFALGALLCVALPITYEQTARKDLAERTTAIAVSAAALFDQKLRPNALVDAVVEGEGNVLEDLKGWLSTQQDLEAMAVSGPNGEILGSWPGAGGGWMPYAHKAEAGSVWEGSRYFEAATPITGATLDGATLRVRMSTERMTRALENVRWLFFSITLLGGSAFFVLARYLSTAILQPLARIRMAARDLADGEPTVNMPDFRDTEIAELGSFISQLGDNRRESRVIKAPDLAMFRKMQEKRMAEKPQHPQPPNTPPGGNAA